MFHALNIAAISPTDLGRIMLLVVALPAMLLGMLLLVIALIARVQGRARRSRGQRVLVYLESAARLGAPLPEMVEAAAATEGGKFGYRLWELARQLRDGRTLRDALAIATPEVPARHRELIGAGERTGRLARGLSDLLERERRDEQLSVRTVEWLYPVVILMVLLSILSGVMVFIWPKFQEIYADFGADLPALASTVLGQVMLPNISSAVLSESGAAVIGFATLFMGMFALITVIVVMIVIFHRWASMPVPLFLGHLGDGLSAMACRLPIVGRAMHDRQLADICYVLAAALRADMPLDAALIEAQRLRLDPVLRWRIIRWADRLQNGEATDRAARSAGLPRLVSGMLATGQAAAEPAEAFDFLYRYYSGRFSRFLELARGAIVPGAVLAMGTIVGLIVVAMLSPLFTLIELMTRGDY